jgi:hypothetical protein
MVCLNYSVIRNWQRPPDRRVKPFDINFLAARVQRADRFRSKEKMADESKRDHRRDLPSDPFPAQMKDTSIEDRQPEENLRFADAVNACELLRAQGRMEEAKAWSDRNCKRADHRETAHSA